VVDAVDPVFVVGVETHGVAGDVEDDESLQVLQFDGLFHVAYQIVTEVELHQALKVLKPVKS